MNNKLFIIFSLLFSNFAVYNIFSAAAQNQEITYEIFEQSVKNNDQIMIKKILSCNNKGILNQFLLKAVDTNNTEATKLLLTHKIDLLLPHDCMYTVSCQCSPKLNPNKTKFVDGDWGNGGYNEIQLLSIAAAHGNKEIVTLLLKNGAEINSTDLANLPAIAHAFKNDHHEVVETLLKSNADLEDFTKYHYNVNTKKSIKSWIKLLEYNPIRKIYWTNAITALNIPNDSLIKYVLANNLSGYELHHKEIKRKQAFFAFIATLIFNYFDHGPILSLIFLASLQKFGILELNNLSWLTEKNNAGLGGMTPLLWAVAQKNLECIKQILAHNVALEPKNIFGEDAFMLAHKHNRLEIAKLIYDDANIEQLFIQNGISRPLAILINQYLHPSTSPAAPLRTSGEEN